MFMQQRLGLKMAQKPVLTQSLRQLVKLLALNKLELKEEIAQELTENPVLELAAGTNERESSLDAAAEAEARRNGSDSSDSGKADKDDDLPNDPFSEIDLGKFFDDYLGSGSKGPAPEVVDKPTFETFLSSPTTLTDHLMWQLSLTQCSAGERAAAEAIVGNLNEDGYLSVDLEEIQAESGSELVEVEDALEMVQQFDPLGVGSRDLQECLLIQIRAIEADDDLPGIIVRDHWDDLQNDIPERTANLAAACEATHEEVDEALREIRALDPRPGRRYGGSEVRAVEPDVEFQKNGAGFRVVLHEDDVPDLRLNRSYRGLMKRGVSAPEVRNYIKERYNSAIQLLRNIDQRRQTIRGVCDVIARRQPGFLAGGLEHLRPMMIKEVAEESGVHPSTVSRAVANKYALTPHGVYELRFFFTEGVQGPGGASLPLLLLKRKVKKMIEDEDPAKPLTDDKLSKMLREEGIHVTRRTVAKYREDMNIPSTHKRRRKRR